MQISQWDKKQGIGFLEDEELGLQISQWDKKQRSRSGIPLFQLGQISALNKQGPPIWVTQPITLSMEDAMDHPANNVIFGAHHRGTYRITFSMEHAMDLL